jgi:hypothetical protein
METRRMVNQRLEQGSGDESCPSQQEILNMKGPFQSECTRKDIPLRPRLNSTTDRLVFTVWKRQL